MAPRFRKRDESVEAGFRRIAHTEIDEAVAIIDAHDRTDADKVHKVRRQLKALRALLRLVRPAFGRFDKENRRFRDMARALSHMRDAKVMLETFDTIAGTGKARPLTHKFALVRERLSLAQDAHDDLATLLKKTRAGLIKTRKRAEKWSLEKDGWSAVSGGLSDTYKAASKAMADAFRTHDAQASHEWRKGVKYHGAHMRFIHAMRPDVFGKREKLAVRLGDVLGVRHDIDMFLDTLARAPAHYGDVLTVTQLAGLARLRSARLDRQARRLGEKLFEDKAAKVAHHWSGWWEDWRG